MAIVGVCSASLALIVHSPLWQQGGEVTESSVKNQKLQKVGRLVDDNLLAYPDSVSYAFSETEAFSEYAPNLDAVSGLFEHFSVNNASDVSDGSSLKEIVDSLLIRYLQPEGYESPLVKRQLLREVPNGYPVVFKGVTSPFGVRIHPVLGMRKPHYGIDLRAAVGTPVLSTADGIVEFSGVRADKRAMGRFIIVYHNHGFQTTYAHLKKILVKQGDFVKKGQIVALSGESGVTDGPHLHYGIRFLQVARNPAHYLKWNEENFESIFQEEKDVHWSLLIDRIYAHGQNLDGKAYQVVER